ncbi:hypothetical protein BDQ12DRAFT_683924 [Crucibulum laeve]|uniref:Domain of unknown function at the cortex 1 domain-containing protein n=1 Tax=Crucibulum laeve TaxID=68775 RepID=A0A5C3M063_9AGAR|nr:hypothetical protein BDQ12DRAFT_683924 [Crucibulum laeve]
MAPRLRVRAGTSPETMVPITSIVNTGRSQKISSEVFDGEVVAHIKGFTDEHGNLRDSEYFSRADRQGTTWSIQVQGRFLVPYSADDILFGNTFDRPLKLPWGTSAVLKFMNYVDPTLEHDLQSNTKPWALSPLISTMPHFVHSRMPSNSASSSPSQGSPLQNGSAKYLSPNTASKPRKPDMHLDLSLPSFPPPHSIDDDTSQLYLASTDLSSPSSETGSTSGSDVGSPGSSASSIASTGSGKLSKGSLRNAFKKVGRRKRRGGDAELSFANATERRSYFSSAKNRQDIQFGPMDVITTDFCYGFINFSPSLSLQVPGGLSFDLMKYWDGQPVRFVCCERKVEGGGTKNKEEDPWGRIFWCVAIEMVDDDDDDELNGDESNEVGSSDVD